MACVSCILILFVDCSARVKIVLSRCILIFLVYTCRIGVSLFFENAVSRYRRIGMACHSGSRQQERRERTGSSFPTAGPGTQQQQLEFAWSCTCLLIGGG